MAFCSGGPPSTAFTPFQSHYAPVTALFMLLNYTCLWHSAVGSPPLQLLPVSPIMSLWQSSVTPGILQLPLMYILQINGPIISLWHSSVLHSAVGPPSTTVTPSQSYYESMAICSCPLYFTVAPFCILQLLLIGHIISLWYFAVTFCSWSPSTTVTPSQSYYESMAICSCPLYFTVAPFCILQLLLIGHIISLWYFAVTFCSWSPSTTVTPSQTYYESMAICSCFWHFTVAPFCILQLLLIGPIISLWYFAVTFSSWFPSTTVTSS